LPRENTCKVGAKGLSYFDLVTLKEFKGGFGWHQRIKHDLKELASLFLLKGITKVVSAAGKLGLEVLNWRPYESAKLAIKFSPLPNVVLILLFTYNEEFGANANIFLERRMLGYIPTEEAVGLEEVLIDALSFLLTHEEERSAVETLPIEGKRRDILLMLPEQILKESVIHLKGSISLSSRERWETIFQPFPILRMVIKRDGSSVTVTFTSHTPLPGTLLRNLAWLYCNAILREARRIDNTIPPISNNLLP